MKTPQSFETSVTTHPAVQRHKSADLNPHITVLYEIKHGDNLLHISICCKYLASYGVQRYGKPLCTILLTGLETSYGALATFLNMVQVLAHDLSVTHIYIFVTGRNYPLFVMPELNAW
jgi:hypothetical protein